MSNKDKTKFVELVRIKIDFDKLLEWKDPMHDNIPVCSILALYRACGVQDYITKYNEEYKEVSKIHSICPADNLKVNTYTFQRIRNFIKDNWEGYYLDLIGDNNPVWIENQKYHKRGRPHKLKAKILHSINADFLNYAPGLYEDNDLEDDYIIIGYIEDNIIEGEIK